MGYGTKVKLPMDGCAFLHGGGGICPYNTKICKEKCDKYSQVGDPSKEIFHDWNNGIEKLKLELRLKHFGTTEKLDINPIVKQEQEEFNEEDFLG